MQVFKAFLKTARKSMPHNLMYFFIFSGIALALSFSSKNPEDPIFQSVELDIGIIDQDHSTASKALSQYLNTMHQLSLMTYDKEAILDQLFFRNLDYILILPEGFETRLLLGEETLFETVQIPGVYSSAFVDEQINAYLNTLKLYLTADYSLNDAINQTADTLSQTSNHVRVLELDDKKSSSMNGIYYYYQYLPYVIMSIILCGLTPILTTFWEPNLSKRISCSSTSALSRNLQLAFGSIVYCFGIWLLFILTSCIFYGSELFTENGLLCIGNSFFLLPVGVGVSLIISSFAPPSNRINMYNNIITLGMSFLCGIFVPQQLLGEQVLSVSKFLPFYWYIKNNNLISGFSGETFQMETYQKNIGIQALFIAAIFAVALVISKYKSERHST